MPRLFDTCTISYLDNFYNKSVQTAADSEKSDIIGAVLGTGNEYVKVCATSRIL